MRFQSRDVKTVQSSLFFNPCKFVGIKIWIVVLTQSLKCLTCRNLLVYIDVQICISENILLRYTGQRYPNSLIFFSVMGIPITLIGGRHGESIGSGFRVKGIEFDAVKIWIVNGLPHP